MACTVWTESSWPMSQAQAIKKRASLSVICADDELIAGSIRIVLWDNLTNGWKLA